MGILLLQLCTAGCPPLVSSGDAPPETIPFLLQAGSVCIGHLRCVLTEPVLGLAASLWTTLSLSSRPQLEAQYPASWGVSGGSLMHNSSYSAKARLAGSSRGCVPAVIQQRSRMLLLCMQEKLTRALTGRGRQHRLCC